VWKHISFITLTQKWWVKVVKVGGQIFKNNNSLTHHFLIQVWAPDSYRSIIFHSSKYVAFRIAWWAVAHGLVSQIKHCCVIQLNAYTRVTACSLYNKLYRYIIMTSLALYDCFVIIIQQGMKNYVFQMCGGRGGDFAFSADVLKTTFSTQYAWNANLCLICFYISALWGSLFRPQCPTPPAACLRDWCQVRFY